MHKTFTNYIFQYRVVTTAIKVSLFVGTLLAVINHYQAFFSLSELENRLIPILLTYLVPYSVSTYSSVKMLLAKEMEDKAVKYLNDRSLYEERRTKELIGK